MNIRTIKKLSKVIKTFANGTECSSHERKLFKMCGEQIEILLKLLHKHPVTSEEREFLNATFDYTADKFWLTIDNF